MFVLYIYEFLAFFLSCLMFIVSSVCSDAVLISSRVFDSVCMLFDVCYCDVKCFTSTCIFCLLISLLECSCYHFVLTGQWFRRCVFLWSIYVVCVTYIVVFWFFCVFLLLFACFMSFCFFMLFVLSYLFVFVFFFLSATP